MPFLQIKVMLHGVRWTGLLCWVLAVDARFWHHPQWESPQATGSLGHPLFFLSRRIWLEVLDVYLPYLHLPILLSSLLWEDEPWRWSGLNSVSTRETMILQAHSYPTLLILALVDVCTARKGCQDHRTSPDLQGQHSPTQSISGGS